MQKQVPLCSAVLTPGKGVCIASSASGRFSPSIMRRGDVRNRFAQSLLPYPVPDGLTRDLWLLLPLVLYGKPAWFYQVMVGHCRDSRQQASRVVLGSSTRSWPGPLGILTSALPGLAMESPPPPTFLFEQSSDFQPFSSHGTLSKRCSFQGIPLGLGSFTRQAAPGPTKGGCKGGPGSRRGPRSQRMEVENSMGTQKMCISCVKISIHVSR